MTVAADKARIDYAKASRKFSANERDKEAKSGEAMDDGSYPIPDKGALRRAIQAYGRSKNKEATKAHIIKRAKALDAEDMLPEDWLSKAVKVHGGVKACSDEMKTKTANKKRRVRGSPMKEADGHYV